MYQRILIPLDGSPFAEQAVPLAKMLAVRFQSTLVLFQVIQPITRGQVQRAVVHADDQAEPLQSQAREHLEAIALGFPDGIAVRCEVRVGLPARAILEFAESDPVDLIVMAAQDHAAPQRWVNGGVAEEVLHGARLPVLLVKASQPAHMTPSIKRILVPLDGSALAEQALIPAQHLAHVFDADLLLLRVQEPAAYGPGEPAAEILTAAFDDAVHGVVEEYLTEKTREMRSCGVRVGWATLFGTPAEGILDAAHDRTANLIVMSTHGRSGVGRWVMGSVADCVLRAARVPVLLIRSAE